MESKSRDKKIIKLVFWDLDNTLWKGVLLENDDVSLRPGARDILKAFDDRGILQSIASRNDYDCAVAKLKEFGVLEYFLYPQINWNSKASSIKAIVQLINVGLDSVAFIDDDAFEREEVKYSAPDVLCIDSADLETILDLPEMNPRFITDDSKQRRQMYISEIERKKAEDEFDGPQNEFLATLGLRLTIEPAKEEHLKRAEELTLRTNQLNTTSYTYSYDELNELSRSSRHKLTVASLTDKFGTYGKIGLCLVECEEQYWTVKLLLMSCRVMSRGVGTVMLSHIMNLAKDANVKLRAEYIPNGRNRMMYITYKLANFKEVARRDGLIFLEHDCSQHRKFPDYVKVTIQG